MGVTYELIDAPYPYLCAVYRCECGATAVQHAGVAATPPADWRRVADAGRQDRYVCPACGGSRPSAEA
ncbi:MAG: hypothetical protein ACXVYV_01890 [Gaiellales bacterium]